jgi:hypothetical protein
MYCCKVVCQDVEDFNENFVCFLDHLVPRNIGVSKCNFFLLWMATSYTYVIQSSCIPYLGCYSNHCRYVFPCCQALCFEPNSRLLIVIWWTHLCFHFMHWYESSCREDSSFLSATNLWEFWFKTIRIQIENDDISHKYFYFCFCL